MTGADRIAIDTHPYFAFGAQADPIDTGTGAGAGGVWPATACSNWAAGFNTRWARLLMHKSRRRILTSRMVVAQHLVLRWQENGALRLMIVVDF